MNVIGYRRVSTGKQANDGHGMDAQRGAIERWAEYHGHTVTWVEDPAVSGRRAKRPGLDYARDLLKRGEAGALVVHKLDRLARSVRDLANLTHDADREGWALVVLHPDIDFSTSAGRLVANVLSAIAEFEADMISERITAALAAAKVKGITPGPKAKPLPAETLARVNALAATSESLAAIAYALTQEGYPLPSGRCGTWQPTQVKRAMRVALDQSLGLRP